MTDRPEPTHRAFIALGSNIDSEHNMREAVRLLAERTRLIAVSPVYETAPVAKIDQPNFLNAAALVETDLSAAQLKAAVLQKIERTLGRVRTADKNAPRTIDLDITLFDDEVFELENRHIPDPDLLHYPHIAIPMADLAQEFSHPETGQTLLEIATQLPDSGLVQRTDVSL